MAKITNPADVALRRPGGQPGGAHVGRCTSDWRKGPQVERRVIRTMDAEQDELREFEFKKVLIDQRGES